MAPVIESLETADVERYKVVRLEALADAPNAFGSTLAEERQLTDERWHQRLANPETVASDQHSSSPYREPESKSR